MELAEVLKDSSLESYDRAARSGVPRGFVDDLAKKLDVRLGELAPYLHVSERTLRRYNFDQLLPPDVSDRALSVARVFEKTVEVLDSQDLAARWLKHPNEALRAVPFTLLDNTFGTERVLQVLGRIEHGIFS